jgi:LysM repeat protein
MPDFKITTYVANKGDTLDSIARRYRFKSWKEIYTAPCNADLRRKRPKPDRIQPGDRVNIPPDPVAVLQVRLKTLQDLRANTEQQFNQLLGQLQSDYQKVLRIKEGVDVTATVAQLFVALTKLIAAGFKALSLSGEKLAALNNDLAKTWMSGRVQDVAGLIGSSTKITGEEGLGWAIGKILLKSWSDMTSPSYWAARVAGDPEDAYRNARTAIMNAKAAALKEIDRRISTTRSLMGARLN